MPEREYVGEHRLTEYICLLCLRVLNVSGVNAYVRPTREETPFQVDAFVPESPDGPKQMHVNQPAVQQ